MLSRIPLILIAFGFAALYGTPAAAQCRLCTAPTTTIETDDKSPPVHLEVDTNLDFDRLIVGGSGSGSAILSPDGSRQAMGAILSIGGRAMVGTVTVRGEPGRAVRISLPTRIALHGLNGGEIAIDSVTSDLPAFPRIGSNGSLAFRIGGALHISGETDGDYRGDFMIDVDYF